MECFENCEAQHYAKQICLTLGHIYRLAAHTSRFNCWLICLAVHAATGPFLEVLVLMSEKYAWAVHLCVG